MKRYYQQIVDYRELLWNLVGTELKLRYRNSILGFLWTILNPLFFLLILAVVFSRIIKFQMDNYIIFLFSGLTSWLMIQQTVLIATGSIVNNQGLIKKVYVPKILFPLSNVLARFIDHLVLTMILIGFMLYFHMDFTWNLLLVPAVVLMLFFFSLGLSLIASVFYIRIRDVQNILSIAFQAFFYLTPILYPLEVLPASFQKVFLLNPFYYFIQSFRFPVYSAQFPPGRIFWVALGLTVIVFFTGLGIFYKREKYFVFNLS